ncbi:hypothetical protein BJV78DRAFT_1154102 [Lactifluus subvellereus]|nr:hypothetical protein BJV78DRAFT_1154102 [Lactifluus subvellereus]
MAVIQQVPWHSLVIFTCCTVLAHDPACTRHHAFQAHTEFEKKTRAGTPTMPLARYCTATVANPISANLTHSGAGRGTIPRETAAHPFGTTTVRRPLRSPIIRHALARIRGLVVKGTDGAP